MIKINKSTLYFYIPLIIVLLPTFPTLLGNMGNQCIFILELFLLLILYSIKIYHFSFDRIIISIVIFYLLSILFSISCETIKGSFVYSDTFELLKPFTFYMLYALYRNSSVPTHIIENNTIKTLKYIFVILIAYSILEFLFHNQVINISYFLYKREGVRVLRDKAIGSFSQTYQFAFILLLPLILTFIHFLKEKTIKNIIPFAFVFFTLLLTQSRSMYISAVLALSICFFLPILHQNIKSTISTFSLVAIIICIFTGLYLTFYKELEIIFAYAFNGFESMATGDNNSVNIRKEQVLWAIDNNNLILIGNGIGKGANLLLESFYSLYYYRFGLIGVVLYMTILLRTSLISYRNAKILLKMNNINTSIFYYAISVFFLITPISLLSSCHQDTPKISFIFYGIMGLVYARHRSLQINRNLLRKNLEGLHTKALIDEKTIFDRSL